MEQKPNQAAQERAQKRVGEIQAFFQHLFGYLAVNALLVVIDLVDGNHGTGVLGLNWAYWPILGWGIAVAIHGVRTFLWIPGGGTEDRRDRGT